MRILRYLTSGQNFKNAVNNASAGFVAPRTDITVKVYLREVWKVAIALGPQIVANLESGQNLKNAVFNANAATANKTWFAMINGVKTQVAFIFHIMHRRAVLPGQD